MNFPAPANSNSGDSENDFAAQLREFSGTTLPGWEKEARDEILQLERVEEWKEELKKLRGVLIGVSKLTSSSTFVSSVKEFEMDISRVLDLTGEAILDYIDFVSIGRPPKGDVHGNAAFIRERRVFQREILDQARLLSGSLIKLKFSLA